MRVCTYVLYVLVTPLETERLYLPSDAYKKHGGSTEHTEQLSSHTPQTPSDAATGIMPFPGTCSNLERYICCTVLTHHICMYITIHTVDIAAYSHYAWIRCQFWLKLCMYSVCTV